MPLSLSSSLTSSLNALPHNLLVIDSYGFILFINDHWKELCHSYGFSPAHEWIGVHYLELFEKWIAIPVQLTALNESIQHILQGGVLVASSEFILHTPDKMGRVFRLDAFPLLSGQSAGLQTLALSMRDSGPGEIRQTDPVRGCHPMRPRPIPSSLVPICASCKSVRNSKEEWLSVERYLQFQLSLQFTHDICPDCIRQLYPKYAGALNR
ncbi:PAS domain-containing protein [Paenibacillus pedocola]|uniref:PAS domain-containing protein n=1 Tax=Paenibacillus pedocola TaxID=3242193 RepID=UPI002877765B|nr:PAS domain-containing protein [Paenibacillus typhae]